MDPKPGSIVTLHAFITVVLAAESGRKDQKHFPYGNIADRTQIQLSVRSIGTRAEAEAAALVRMRHTGDKHEPVKGKNLKRFSFFILNGQGGLRTAGRKEQLQQIGRAHV